MKYHFYLAFLFSILTFNLHSQVGVNNENPNELTELEVSNIINGTDTIPKGIIIPRLTEKLRDAMDVKNNENPNGLFIYNIDEDCYNYYSKEDSEWKSLCGKMGNAVFDPIDCSDIEVKGQYVENTGLDASNYLIINVNVKKIGNYIINGTTGNGYYFSFQGTVLEKGVTTIRIPSMGKPQKAQTDYITLTGIPVASGCKPEVIVKEATATYSINCSSTTVYGIYYKNEALTANHYIMVNVNVAIPGTYYISTNTKQGIQFTAQGNFTAAGVQQVKLLSNGTPNINTDFDLTITTNTLEGNSECIVKIPITLPAMTYAIIGNSAYSWSSNERQAALNGGSFKPDGEFRIKSFTNLWTQATTNNPTEVVNSINNGVNGKQPDVILYFAYGAPPNANISQALSNYINKGGCVLYGSADGTSAQVNILLNGVFGIQTAQAQIAGGPSTDDNTYPINQLPTDPIINGPFGNIGGTYWGEDNASTGSVILTSLPQGSVQICSANNVFGKANVDPSYSIVWYNDNKNFVFFGDCVATTTSREDQNGYPSLYIGGYPYSKYYGNWGGSGHVYVYNSALELNSLAYLVRKAALNGINIY